MLDAPANRIQVRRLVTSPLRSAASRHNSALSGKTGVYAKASHARVSAGQRTGPRNPICASTAHTMTSDNNTLLRHRRPVEVYGVTCDGDE